MRWFITTLLATSLTTGLAAQTTLYVDASGCGPIRDGAPGSPFCLIQEAIDVATSGDTVLVRPGLYQEDVWIAGVQLTLRSALEAGAVELRALDQNYAISIAQGADVTLEGLGFAGAGGVVCMDARLDVQSCLFRGNSENTGGAIQAEFSELRVSECRFEGNQATMGGSIYALGGTVQIEDSWFTAPGLKSLDGGALWLEDASSTISRCSFQLLRVENSASAIGVRGGQVLLEDSAFARNNVFDFAGTVAIQDAAAIVRRCTFRDNRSSVGWGGAIFIRTDPLLHDVEISDCAFARNSAAEGGAIAVWRGRASILRCEFLHNLSSAGAFFELGYGGAILVGGSGGTNAFAHIESCSFVENTARGDFYLNDGKGGAVYGPADLRSCTFYLNRVSGRTGDGPTGGAVAGGAFLEDCIVWENKPDQLEATTSARWSDVQGGWPGEGNLDADPKFWNRALGDLYLLPSSPCIDAGDPALTDPDGSRIDMGAFPFDPEHGSLGRIRSH